MPITTSIIFRTDRQHHKLLEAGHLPRKVLHMSIILEVQLQLEGPQCSENAKQLQLL